MIIVSKSAKHSDVLIMGQEPLSRYSGFGLLVSGQNKKWRQIFGDSKRFKKSPETSASIPSLWHLGFIFQPYPTFKTPLCHWDYYSVIRKKRKNKNQWPVRWQDVEWRIFFILSWSELHDTPSQTEDDCRKMNRGASSHILRWSQRWRWEGEKKSGIWGNGWKAKGLWTAGKILIVVTRWIREHVP